MAAKVKQRARLQDVRDREILSAMADLADDEGWVTSAEVAKAYNIQAERAVQCAGARLSWMKRWGLVERGPKGWRLSNRGDQLKNGHIDKALESHMKGMSETQVVDMTTALARRSMHSSSREAAIVSAREWRYWHERRPQRVK